MSDAAPNAVRPSADVARAFVILFSMVAAMWLLELIDVPLNGELDQLGIEPRKPEGLIGIPFAPFLHTGFGHLTANTLPLLILGGVVALSGSQRLIAVTIIAALASGFGTWAVGEAGSLHIGASGVVFGYATYLMVRGLYSGRFLHLAVGAAVLLIYGATFILSLAPKPGVSWQGHLFGALGGALAAAVLERDAVQAGRLRPPIR